jgi:DNA-directed RNA polymerase subunit RPC12/RpoP
MIIKTTAASITIADYNTNYSYFYYQKLTYQGGNYMDWYKCSECGQKLFKITPDAVIKGIQIKCKQCRKLINVSHEPKDSNN